MYLEMRVLRRLDDNGNVVDENAIQSKWDEYGCSNLVELIKTVGYWRKENAIHKFFVDTLQDGKDECKESYCGKETLEELRNRCVRILNSIDGVVIRVAKKNVGKFKEENQYWTSQGKTPYIQRVKLHFPGEDLDEFEKTVNKLNYYHSLSGPQRKVAEKLLPTQDGFFFGSTEYNGWYLQGLVKTIKMIGRALELSKKESGDLYYRASW